MADAVSSRNPKAEASLLKHLHLQGPTTVDYKKTYSKKVTSWLKPVLAGTSRRVLMLSMAENELVTPLRHPNRQSKEFLEFVLRTATTAIVCANAPRPFYLPSGDQSPHWETFGYWVSTEAGSGKGDSVYDLLTKTRYPKAAMDAVRSDLYAAGNACDIETAARLACKTRLASSKCRVCAEKALGRRRTHADCNFYKRAWCSRHGLQRQGKNASTVCICKSKRTHSCLVQGFPSRE